MKIELTESEMLELWRRTRGLDMCGVYNAVTDRVDGLDVDALLKQQMRGWYADLLAHGPEEMLVCTNLAVALNACGDLGWEAILPEAVVRVFGVHAKGYLLPIRIVEDAVANPYTSPVAVLNGRRLVVMPFDEKPELLRVRVVTRPTDGNYVFDDCALKQIFPHNPKEI